MASGQGAWTDSRQTPPEAGRHDRARAHPRRSGNAIKHLESLEIGSLINCADEAIDATAETFSSGRISALKEMETLGKLMIEQDMRALGA